MNHSNPTLQLYDLYDLWYEAFWHKPWFWPTLVGIFLIVIGSLAVLLWKKRKQNTYIAPWKKVLNELEKIDIATFKASSEHKQFYSKLTKHLKIYFSYRYNLALTSKTDDEVLATIASTPFPQDLQMHLEEIFRGATYIKFAKQSAALERIERDLSCAKRLIMEIKESTEDRPT